MSYRRRGQQVQQQCQVLEELCHQGQARMQQEQDQVQV